MSQSATLYRIPELDPEERRASGRRPRFTMDAVKDSAIFENSLDGLLFVLSHGQPAEQAQCLSEIFSPRQTAGKGDFEEWVFGGDETPVSYLPPEVVAKIDVLLQEVNVADIDVRFDADELKRQCCYSEAWPHDDPKGPVHDASQLARDLANLKCIFRSAAAEGDFIFAFVG